MDVGRPSWLLGVGAVELALGATLGWALAATIERPDLVKRLGVVKPGRIGQAHLDYIIMGILLLAAGVAAPTLATVPSVLLAVGAWVNATLFLPLAWRPGLSGHPAYKAFSVASFACMTSGTIWLAVHLTT